MLVKKISCAFFRNIERITIEPCDGMNVICGENAQGKTNLLEAIWLFTGAKSFRESKDSALVKFGCEKAKNELIFTAQGVENTAVLEINEHRHAFLNDSSLHSAAMLAGSFNAIIFSPGDLSLVKDGPSVRRRFIDIAIGQLYPGYIELLRKYNRAVMQRNQVIKDLKYDSSLSVMLDVFEEEIAANGEKIVKYREKYIEMLSAFFPEIYEGLSGGREKMHTAYIAVCRTGLLDELKKRRREDMFSGVTSVGPHRDDIDFRINGISARSYGSQGQKRSVALSLKLAEAEVIKKISGEYPVCLLDDVMSELDPVRQNYILNHIKGWQSFLTCCDPSNTERLREGRIFKIEKGGIKD